MRACLSIWGWGSCIWESSYEPRSLCLSGFEWQFLGVSNWISVFVPPFILLVDFREMWG